MIAYGVAQQADGPATVLHLGNGGAALGREQIKGPVPAAIRSQLCAKRSSRKAVSRLIAHILETILKSTFYIGRFVWRGIEYKGTHAPLISPELFERVQRAFARRNKPKYRKHNFAFAGLLKCAHDGCTVTTELQKNRYIYYRCSQGRGKCSLPYMREQDVSDHLGELLKGHPHSGNCRRGNR
jgi:hypothetical protein